MNFNLIFLLAILFVFQACDKDDEIIEVEDCTNTIAVRENSCSEFTFYNIDQANMDWTVNGEFIERGRQFKYEALSAGAYEICGAFEKEECPSGGETCKTIEVTEECLPANPCAIELVMNQNSCSSYAFSNTLEAHMDWKVDDALVGSGPSYEYNATAVGTYEICGFFETPTCPEGKEVCKTLEIEEAYFSNAACQVELEYTENTCSSFSFSNTLEVPMDWKVNDEVVSTGDIFTFEATAAGTYMICGLFETTDCPTGGQACKTVEIAEDCFSGDACTIDLMYTENSCSSFTISNSLQLNVQWLLNGEMASSGEVYDFEATAAGEYEICGLFETPDCPEGGQACKTIQVDTDCFDNSSSCDVALSSTENSCSSFSFVNTAQVTMEWKVNSEAMVTGSTFDFEATESGEYEICGFYETPDCPEGSEVCMTIQVDAACFDNTACEVELSMNENACSSFTFGNSLQVVMDWSVNGAVVFTGGLYTFDATEAGSYEICGLFETPDCPLGGQECITVQIAEDCFDNSACDITLSINENSCSSYTFGNSMQVTMDWTVNGAISAAGPIFNYEATEAGSYEICGLFETPDCPIGGQACTTIQIGDDCFTNSACQIELEITENSCSSFTFENSFLAVIDWTVDGSYMTTDQDFDFEADAAGSYEVCGLFESPSCPEGAQVCETIVVGDDCMFNEACQVSLSMVENSCSSFSFSNSIQAQMFWEINGAFVSFGDVYTFQATEPGTYEVCGRFESQDCPEGGEDCITIMIDADCF